METTSTTKSTEKHINGTKCILVILSSTFTTSKRQTHSTKPVNIIKNTSITITDDSKLDNYDYTIDILMPLVVGLFVALILGWMLIRYKMSSHQRSNYNGSIYCCPEECFEFCAKFFECKIKFKLPKIMKRVETNKNREITVNKYPECQNLVNPVEIPSINLKKSPIVTKRPSIKSNSSNSTGTRSPNGNQSTKKIIINNEENVSSTNSSTRIPNGQSNLNINYLNPNSAIHPLRFLNRDSFSSRRDSFVMPDLIKSSNFSMNLFHSFQSKNSTTLA